MQGTLPYHTLMSETMKAGDMVTVRVWASGAVRTGVVTEVWEDCFWWRDRDPWHDWYYGKRQARAEDVVEQA